VDLTWKSVGRLVSPRKRAGYSILQKCVQPSRAFFAGKMAGFASGGKGWVFGV